MRNLVTFGDVINGIAAHYGMRCSIDVYRCVRRRVRAAGRAGRVAAGSRRSVSGRGVRGVVVGRIIFVRRCTIWIVGGCICGAGMVAGIAYDDGCRLLAGACAEDKGEGCRACVKCGFFQHNWMTFISGCCFIGTYHNKNTPCSQVLQPLVTVKLPDFDRFACLKILRIIGMNCFIFFM